MDRKEILVFKSTKILIVFFFLHQNSSKDFSAIFTSIHFFLSHTLLCQFCIPNLVLLFLFTTFWDVLLICFQLVSTWPPTLCSLNLPSSSRTQAIRFFSPSQNWLSSELLSYLGSLCFFFYASIPVYRRILVADYFYRFVFIIYLNFCYQWAVFQINRNLNLFILYINQTTEMWLQITAQFQDEVQCLKLQKNC